MKIFNRLQGLYLTAYKSIGLLFILAMVIGIVVYGAGLAFFSVNSNWSAPVTLSPSQERVLSFQPQVIALEGTIDKQTIELATAKASVQAMRDQLPKLGSLLNRMTSATAAEASALATTAAQLQEPITAKKGDITSTAVATADAKKLLAQIDAELASKLITSDQAAQRRVALQASLNAATDARTSAVQLDQTAEQLKRSAQTLRGGSGSLTALTAVAQQAQLQTTEAALKIQLATAESTVGALERSIAETKRVLDTAKTSPFYRALREPVTVGFMPYENVDAAVPGAKVYECYLKFIGCYEVGTVTQVYEAEEYAHHPLFKTDLKGRFVDIKFTDAEAARAQVLFIGRKPLFI